MPLGFSDGPGWTGGEAFGLNPVFPTPFPLHFSKCLRLLCSCRQQHQRVESRRLRSIGVEWFSGNPGMIRCTHDFEDRKVQRRCWNHVGQQVDIKVDVGLGELRHIATEAQKTHYNM